MGGTVSCRAACERWVMYETENFPQCCVDFCYSAECARSTCVAFAADCVGHNYRGEHQLAKADQLHQVFLAFAADVERHGNNTEELVGRVHQLSAEMEAVGRSSTLSLAWTAASAIHCLNIGDGAVLARLQGVYRLVRGFNDDTRHMELAGDIRRVDVVSVPVTRGDLVMGITDGVLDLLSENSNDDQILLRNLEAAVAGAASDSDPASVIASIRAWSASHPPSEQRADYDTYLGIFETCASITCLSQNDDDVSCSPQSRIQDFTTSPSTSYILQVGGYSTNAGSGTVLLSAVPLNDACPDAIPVATLVPTPFSTKGAQPFSGPCPSMDSSPSVFFRWTAPSSPPTMEVEFTLCNATADYDTRIGIFSACASMTCLASNDDYCGTASRALLTVSANNDYIIQVAGFGTGAGSGTLLVAPFTAASFAPTLAPSAPTMVAPTPAPPQPENLVYWMNRGSDCNTVTSVYEVHAQCSDTPCMGPTQTGHFYNVSCLGAQVAPVPPEMSTLELFADSSCGATTRYALSTSPGECANTGVLGAFQLNCSTGLVNICGGNSCSDASCENRTLVSSGLCITQPVFFGSQSYKWSCPSAGTTAIATTISGTTAGTTNVATTSPTQAPTTGNPTSSMPTKAPTADPTSSPTATPTGAPATASGTTVSGTTNAGTTNIVTIPEVATNPPGTTVVTLEPTVAPGSPTKAPTTGNPTSLMPTKAPTVTSPTRAPTTQSPTPPTSAAPTAAPTTSSPTTSPTIAATTEPASNRALAAGVGGGIGGAVLLAGGGVAAYFLLKRHRQQGVVDNLRNMETPDVGLEEI